MSAAALIRMGSPALLEFSGPDAVRFLNGQVTQDVRAVAGGKVSLPSCVTDAKGRLEFRVWITESPDGRLWVAGPETDSGALMQRLTRYLIADDVEVAELTGKYRLLHLIGRDVAPPPGGFARESKRFGVDGADWWCGAGTECGSPPQTRHLHGDELEALRIANGVPLWGRELKPGLLPPEAGLDATDISYHKGCYIGQEVISRIKYLGKVNKRLVRLELDADHPSGESRLFDGQGKEVGEITSISPIAAGGVRPALGYVKRGAEKVYLAGRGLRVLPL